MKDTKRLKPEEKTENSGEARMTHLLSYEASRGQEIRLHDAEFRGRHYLDFRFYERGDRGMIPTRRGIRLGLRDVKFLEDAIGKWKANLGGLEGRDSVGKSGQPPSPAGGGKNV